MAFAKGNAYKIAMALTMTVALITGLFSEATSAHADSQETSVSTENSTWGGGSFKTPNT